MNKIKEPTKKQIQEQERERAIKELKELCPAGTNVYTVLKHVSSSGMTRHIDVLVIKDNEPVLLNWYIEKLGSYKRGKNYNDKNADSLRVGGCGMDMGFAVVANLASTLFKGDYKQLNQRWL